MAKNHHKRIETCEILYEGVWGNIYTCICMILLLVVFPIQKPVNLKQNFTCFHFSIGVALNIYNVFQTGS